MDKETNRVINSFAKKIKKKFEPSRFVLFGSRARGDNFKSSDYDVLLVSNRFQGIAFPDRMAKVYGYWDNECNLEPLCYTEEEFERKRKQQGIVRTAVKEGIEVRA